MRFTTIAFALVGLLTFTDLPLAQGTSPSTGTPPPATGANVPPAPVGHRQPRQSDITAGQAGSTTQTPNPDPATTAQSSEDARMNRILNGICRGC